MELHVLSKTGCVRYCCVPEVCAAPQLKVLSQQCGRYTVLISDS